MEAKELMTKRKIEKLAEQFESNDLFIDDDSSEENKRIDVFVSHSSADNEFIRKVLLFLRYAKGGVSTYADWQDPKLQHPTNAQTAIRLKERIQRARKLIYVVTNDSLKSVLCSWELGFADRDKGVNDVAILAIKPNNGYWKENEYLEQYPWITYKEGMFKVVKPDNSRQLLYEWLEMK